MRSSQVSSRQNALSYEPDQGRGSRTSAQTQSYSNNNGFAQQRTASPYQQRQEEPARQRVYEQPYTQNKTPLTGDNQRPEQNRNVHDTRSERSTYSPSTQNRGYQNNYNQNTRSPYNSAPVYSTRDSENVSPRQNNPTMSEHSTGYGYREPLSRNSDNRTSAPSVNNYTESRPIDNRQSSANNYYNSPVATSRPVSYGERNVETSTYSRTQGTPRTVGQQSTGYTQQSPVTNEQPVYIEQPQNPQRKIFDGNKSNI